MSSSRSALSTFRFIALIFFISFISAFSLDPTFPNMNTTEHHRHHHQQPHQRMPSYGDEDDDLEDLDDAARNVRFSNRKLVHIAMSAAQQVDWDLLSRSMRGDDEEQQQQQLASVHWIPHKSKVNLRSATPTRIFTRRGNVLMLSFGVMAYTTIPCSLHELKLTLKTITTEAFCDLMGVLFRSDFLSGELMHAATTKKNLATNASPEMLVKAVAFENKEFLFGHNEEWCYLDFAQQILQSDSNVNVFRKTLVSLHPEECFAGKLAPTSRAAQGRDVIAGFLFEEEPDGRAARVAFSGEHFYSESSSTSTSSTGGALRKKSASRRAVKARLLRLAESIEQLNAIVRRRRLGMQVLIDEVHVKPTNSNCAGCKKSFRFTRKKLCNLCGYNVCKKCSAMEDRKRRTRGKGGGIGRPWIVRVRICDRCIACVDQCSYLNMTTEDLMAAGVVADLSPCEPLGAVLTDLLQKKLEDATSETEKAAVFRLVRAMVDQEKSYSSNSSSSTGTPRRTSVILTVASCKPDEAFETLQSQLNEQPTPELSECIVSDNERRRYHNEHPLDPAGDVRYAVPASEAHRLEVVRSQRLAELVNVPELDLICSLASKELGCVGAMVTIVEQDYFHVVATDMEIPTRNFPRHEGFCSRTILDDKPLLVPHLQADVRFSYMEPVKRQNLGFYCGFPLFAEDFTVIGSLCCAGVGTRKLMRSEFVVAKKLAATASRILQKSS